MKFLIFISCLFVSSCSIEKNKKYRENNHFKSYIDLKFSEVVRQDFDVSCGLASLTGVLIDGYGVDVTEGELLDIIGLKINYSFSDLKYLAGEYNKISLPLWMTYEKLMSIESPAILYIKRKGIDHFVSLNHIDEFTIQIKDPAWGMLNYTREQFESYWAIDNNEMGKVLVFISQSKKIEKEPIYTKFININDFICVTRGCE
ncbi:peptidase, C39 family [Moritella viscosa]|nr:cysteine peptidase family C39 domain-containing protein [Moritella viscosa]CED60695.1 peptidase, C39 family [Moritella viscosa]SHO12225.1 Colicin V secretion/processing ATP-binding protein cvaB [Moritella viscosa]